MTGYFANVQGNNNLFLSIQQAQLVESEGASCKYVRLGMTLCYFRCKDIDRNIREIIESGVVADM